MNPREVGNPLVSVIMPTYNAASYLGEAVASVVGQTISDWELIILDDKSSDETYETAKKIAGEDQRIRVVQNEINLGTAGTRNRGVDLSRGRWLAFLDCDDIWYPGKLEKQLQLAGETGAELLYTSYYVYREETGQRTEYSVPAQVDYEKLLRENVIGCSTVLLLREALGERRFLADTYHEDYALWLRLLREGITAAGSPEILADWRIHGQGRSFNKWDAARNRWEVYRQVEHLSFMKSAHVFTVYALRGLRKHKRMS